MSYREEVIAESSNQNVDRCACEGSGWIPINNDEDAPCPYHAEEVKNNDALDRLIDSGYMTTTDEAEVMAALNGGTDQDFIEGYAHDFLDSVLYSGVC